MPPVKPSEKEEATFMADLLGDMVGSFWNAVPTPDPFPVKPKPSHQLQIPRKHRSPQAAESSSSGDSLPQTTVLSPSKVFSAGDVDVTSLLEDAGDWDWDWDWDDMNSDIMTPRKKSPRKITQPLQNSSPVAPYIPETCTRCIVESVIETDIAGLYEKHLRVKVDSSDERRTVILRDDWTATTVHPGDTINILGTFSLVLSSITISSKLNLLILHPDLLLTATALSNASQCRRKPLLSNLIRPSSDATPALAWGNMLHEVMQTCLTAGRWEEAWINERIDGVIHNGLSELVKIDVTVEQAKREVSMKAKGIRAFAEKYLSDTPKPNAILTNTRSTFNQSPSLLAVSQLLDVEEDIWSPTYGLKGKLDATVEAIISDPNPLFPRGVLSTGPKPFEIKTGRATSAMEHRAQTMLYTLLAAERYGAEVNSGLLYYTQSEEVVRVPASRNELRGLIMARNEMATYIMRRNQKSDLPPPDGDIYIKDMEIFEPFLPPTIDDERVCKRCYVLDSCMLYRKAVEDVVDTTSTIADTYELKTSHLTSTHSSFFKRWEALISLEEQNLIRFKKELWTMGAIERESKGRCFSSMVMDTSYAPSQQTLPTLGDGKIHRFTYRFARTYENGTVTPLLNGNMDTGDPVTVSAEPGLLALARGFIIDLTPSSVILGVDHKLCLDTISKRLVTLPQSSLHQSPQSRKVIFRIDKDELFGGMTRIRDNLAQLFYAEGDRRRLELVVDLKTPVFYDDLPTLSPSIANHSVHLNANQQQAMTKILSAQDYALILGMPGTGKTTVIAAIIKTLVSMGKTVLLTSYTHSAVDTILLKLLDADFGILRLGNVDKIHPDVYRYTLASRRPPSTIGQLKLYLMTPAVVATTCLSIDHPLFSRRKFDYCIIDEASQITLPTCLGPLRFAERFVLVGDHFQLPPLVRNRTARKGGLDVSLFRRLSDAHPHAVVDLAYQYRMNEDIMLLSNKLIYGDRLRCGSEKVANRSLVLPDRTFLSRLHSGNLSCHTDGCWIEKVLAESCKAVFLDTDNVPARDSRVGDLVQNEVEAGLVRQVIETTIRSGIREDQIGVITLYRQQVKLLSHLLQHRKEIEILTADRSQGRDKDCIIISMVRSNEMGQIGDLIKDWRRMNVSFTRARSKLIILGSRKTLQGAPLLAEFFNLMESRNWILQLPNNADTLHKCGFDVVLSSPGKRVAEDTEEPKSEKEKMSCVRPAKKVKVKTVMDYGILRGSPILKDLVNGEM